MSKFSFHTEGMIIDWLFLPYRPLKVEGEPYDVEIGHVVGHELGVVLAERALLIVQVDLGLVVSQADPESGLARRRADGVLDESLVDAVDAVVVAAKAVGRRVQFIDKVFQFQFENALAFRFDLKEEKDIGETKRIISSVVFRS